MGIRETYLALERLGGSGTRAQIREERGRDPAPLSKTLSWLVEGGYLSLDTATGVYTIRRPFIPNITKVRFGPVKVNPVSERERLLGKRRASEQFNSAMKAIAESRRLLRTEEAYHALLEMGGQADRRTLISRLSSRHLRTKRDVVSDLTRLEERQLIELDPRTDVFRIKAARGPLNIVPSDPLPSFATCPLSSN